MRLCRAAAETLCQLLAASWAAGQHSAVKAVAELPQGGASEAEQQVALLALGRLACLLSHDSSFTRTAVLLLSEALVAGAPELCPSAYGAAATTLAAVAAACVAAGGGRGCWEYEQVLQLLLRLYVQPSGPARLLLHETAAEGPGAGLLARALERLAAGGRPPCYPRAAPAACPPARCTCAQRGPQPPHPCPLPPRHPPRPPAGVADAHAKLRRQLEASLLATFSELATRPQQRTEDLHALLPAMAAACAGSDNQVARLLAANKSLASYNQLQQAVRADWDVVRVGGGLPGRLCPLLAGLFGCRRAAVCAAAAVASKLQRQVPASRVRLSPPPAAPPRPRPRSCCATSGCTWASPSCPPSPPGAPPSAPWRAPRRCCSWAPARTAAWTARSG
jgi:hypothetical protein